MFELTRANSLTLHIAFANFIASNVVCRLPHGSDSFIHCTLAINPVWAKLNRRDFIETDGQEMEADIALFQSTLGLLFVKDEDLLKSTFEAWKHHTARHNVASSRKRGADRQVSDGSDLQTSPDGSDRQTSGTENGTELNGGFDRRQTSPDGSDFSPELKDDGGFARQTSTGSVLTAVEAKRRREQREMWENVSLVIPRLNWMQWKSFDVQQRLAIADVASALKECNENGLMSPPRSPLKVVKPWGSPAGSKGILSPSSSTCDVNQGGTFADGNHTKSKLREVNSEQKVKFVESEDPLQPSLPTINDEELPISPVSFNHRIGAWLADASIRACV